jgi:hypothetical protein
VLTTVNLTFSNKARTTLKTSTHTSYSTYNLGVFNLVLSTLFFNDCVPSANKCSIWFDLKVWFIQQLNLREAASHWIPNSFVQFINLFKHIHRGGQTRVTRMKPTDPYGSVLTGRVVMGGTVPAVILCGLWRRIRVGCGSLHTTRRCPKPTRRYLININNNIILLKPYSK